MAVSTESAGAGFVTPVASTWAMTIAQLAAIPMKIGAVSRTAIAMH